MVEKENIIEELAFLIRTRRKSAGMSQQELADLSNLSLDAIHRIEKGSRQPKIGTLFDISKALGTTPGEMLGGTATDQKYRPSVTRLANYLEDQPDVVVEAVDKCARAIASVRRSTSESQG